MSKLRWIGVIALILLGGAALSAAQLAAPTGIRSAVPAEYQPLYDTLRSQLLAPASTRGGARGPKPIWGAHLLAADSNRGPVLLHPSTLDFVDLTLDRFQELGIQGVTVAIGYPLFTPSRNPDSAQYIDFYKTVASRVRARGMKFTVEMIVLWINSNFSPWTFDLSGLTLQQFIDDNRPMAQTIIDELHPDYLTILHEPDTNAVVTGMCLFVDSNVATYYVIRVLEGLNRGQTKVGAGSGTWSGPWYANQIAQRTDVDYINIHIYWVNPSSVEAGKEMVAAARAYGKAVVIDEAWLFKTVGTGIEGLASVEGNAAVYRRDVFSFMAPLDQKMLKNLARFAETAGAEYVAPYWSNYFFAYLDYGPATKDLPFKDLVTGLASQAVAKALVAGEFTETGKEYARIIRRSRN